MKLWEIKLIIRARKINLHDKILRILATFQQDNTYRVGHLFEIGLLDTVAFHFDKSTIFIHEREKMTYHNRISTEEYTVPDLEDDILMGYGIDGGFLDIDYSVLAEDAGEIVGNWLEGRTLLGSSLNIIGNACAMVRICVKLF